MKLRITQVLTPIFGLALLFFAYGGIVRVHAKSPHKCMRPGPEHEVSHICGHTDNPKYQHGLGEQSPWMQQHGVEVSGPSHDSLKNQASMDFTDPCICPITCFFKGALNQVPLKDWIKYGLLQRG